MTFVASLPNFCENASDRLCAGSVDCWSQRMDVCIQAPLHENVQSGGPTRGQQRAGRPASTRWWSCRHRPYRLEQVSRGVNGWWRREGETTPTTTRRRTAEDPLEALLVENVLEGGVEGLKVVGHGGLDCQWVGERGGVGIEEERCLSLHDMTCTVCPACSSRHEEHSSNNQRHVTWPIDDNVNNPGFLITKRLMS